MKYKELEQRSMNHANSLALGYDKEYYDRIYNEHLIKEVNLCLKNNNLIDMNEKELVNLLNIYQNFSLKVYKEVLILNRLIYQNKILQKKVFSLKNSHYKFFHLLFY